MEKTFVFIKPNAMKKQKAGAIIQKLQDGGLFLAGAKLLRFSKALAQEFYKEHKDQPFFQELVEGISSCPVLALAFQEENATARARAIVGATDPKQARPGTIRHEYGDSIGENAVHASDSPQSAKRELALIFSSTELFNKGTE